MGQYYKIVFYDYDENKKKIIRMALVPFQGYKIMEHSYIDNDTMNHIELLLSPLSPFYKSRIIWTGDYADNEDNEDNNLYHMCDDELIDRSFSILDNIVKNISRRQYNIIINHTKKQYINKDDYKDRDEEMCIHPLSLLVCDGNGRGGGDYRGINDDLCGLWKDDIISIDNTIPDNYIYFNPKFEE